MPQNWQHLRPISSQDTGASWGPRQKIRCGTEIPTNIKEHAILSHVKMVDIFKCHTSHRIFPATEPLSLAQLRKGAGKCHFPGTFYNKKIFINSMLAGNLLCIYNRICQWYDTENQVLTPRTAEYEAQIDLEPEQLTLITQKKADHATSSRRLVCYNSQRITRR